MTSSRISTLLVLSLAVGINTGCSKTDHIPTSGTITMDGTPLEGANVTFVPNTKPGEGTAAAAITGEGGKYTLKSGTFDGALPGPYKVVVRKMEGEGVQVKEGASEEDEQLAMFDAMMGRGMASKPVVPLHYSDTTRTPFEAEVTANAEENQFDFNIENQ